MSRNSRNDAAHSELTGEQQETWFAWMRVVLRLSYEMNRQLQSDSGLSLADYDVLNALADAATRTGAARLPASALAARIGWERSRLSHHLLRMEGRGLVERARSAADGRVTDAVLTEAGRTALLAATPGHARLVRRLVFDGMDPALLPGLRIALDQVHDQLLAEGTLPAPGPPQERLAGQATDG